MLNPSYQKKSGFTLIEVLIYLSLFSLIIGGSMVAVFQIFNSANHTSVQIVVLEESNYLLQKIDWLLTNTSEVNITETGLEVIKDATFFNLYLNADGTLRLNENNGGDYPLNNDFLKVSALEFSWPDDNLLEINLSLQDRNNHYQYKSFKQWR